MFPFKRNVHLLRLLKINPDIFRRRLRFTITIDLHLHIGAYKLTNWRNLHLTPDRTELKRITFNDRKFFFCE